MFVALETERLILRKIEQRDASFVLSALSNEDVTKYMLIRYYTLAEVQEQMDYYDNHYKNNTGCYWLMEHKKTGENIGVIGINNVSFTHKKAELGYWILPLFNNNGYTTEAATSIIDFCFKKLELNRIEATVEIENTASIRVVEKLKFKHEGTFREYEINNEKFIDLMMFSILRKEFDIN